MILSQLHVHELGTARDIALKHSSAAAIPLPRGELHDHVVALVPSPKRGLLFLFTRSGHALVYDARTCVCVDTLALTDGDGIVRVASCFTWRALCC